MKTKYFLLILVLIVYQSSCKSQINRNDNDNLVITILYDDKSINDSILAGFGFSCLVENSKNVCLFDAGGKPNILIHNLNHMEVDYSKINYVFISHIHDDHMGGLHGVLAKCNQPELSLPFSYPQMPGEPLGEKAENDFKELLNRYKPLVSEMILKKEPVNIADKFFTTGMFENQTYEQALIVPTAKGLIIITGCAHPGILEIVRRSKELLKQDVYFVMGGFHLMRVDSMQVKAIALELRRLTKYIGPCHCTGKIASDIFKEIFKEDYIDIQAGMKFKSGEGKFE